MKILFNFCFLFVFISGCKKTDSPISPLELNGIYDFQVEGVPDENVEMEGIGLVIRLPQNYTKKGMIKVSFRGWEKTLSTPEAMEQGWNQGEVAYEGKFLAINAVTVSVIPFKKPEIIENRKPFNLILNGSVLKIDMFAYNWGTSVDPYTTKEPFKLVNIETGKVTFCELMSTAPKNVTDAVLLTAFVPASVEPGKYIASINKNGHDIRVLDSVFLSRGQPVISQTLWPPFIYNQSRVAVFKGYNLLSDHTYELILSNDFSPPVKIKLFPEDSETLVGSVSADVIPGNYIQQILIDGSSTYLDNVFKTDNILIIQQDSIESKLLSLSEITQKYNTPYGLDVFKPLTSFKRGQDILAVIASPSQHYQHLEKFTRLVFTSLQTRQEYYIYMNSFFLNIEFFHPYFSVPRDFPLGSYEVKYITQPDSIRTFSSQRYEHIIKIE